VPDNVARNQFDQPIRGVSLWLDAWRRLRKNRMALAGLTMFILYALVSLLAPLLPIYTYRYITGGPTMMGVMADEVREVKPDAVARIGEYDAVNYNLIG